MIQPPVLFLDIDGVMSSHRNLLIGEQFDRVALKMLALLQKEHGFLIVLSSIHRKHYTHVEQLTQSLEKDFDVQLKFHQHWKTRHHVEGHDVSLPLNTPINYWCKLMGVDVSLIENVRFCRGLEIQQWLNDEFDTTGEWTDYVVVDDSVDLFPLDPKSYVRIYQGELRGGLQLKHFDIISQKFKRINRNRNKRGS